MPESNSAVCTRPFDRELPLTKQADGAWTQSSQEPCAGLMAGAFREVPG